MQIFHKRRCVAQLCFFQPNSINFKPDSCKCNSKRGESQNWAATLLTVAHGDEWGSFKHSGENGKLRKTFFRAVRLFDYIPLYKLLFKILNIYQSYFCIVEGCAPTYWVGQASCCVITVQTHNGVRA